MLADDPVPLVEDHREFGASRRSGTEPLQKVESDPSCALGDSRGAVAGQVAARDRATCGDSATDRARCVREDAIEVVLPLYCGDRHLLSPSDVTRSAARRQNLGAEQERGSEAKKARHLLTYTPKVEDCHFGQCSGMTPER